MFRIVSTALVILFAFAGSDANASSPPVYNGRIVFSAPAGIASMNPDGSGQWGVELQPGDMYPAWSPDGTTLAVLRRTIPGGNGIELLQPNDDALGMLTTNSGDSLPAWSPDGKTVAFVNGSNIWLVNADGSNRRQLTTDVQHEVSRPTWSPDGTTIAFSAYRQAADNSSTQTVYSVGVETGKEKALTTGWDMNPAWSPDGTTILFESARNRIQGLFAMNPDGSSVHNLLAMSMYADYPTWSPNGTQIAFVGNGQIWVMNADGSSAHQLSTGNYNTYLTYPAWQPLGPPPPGCTLWGTSANDLLVGTNGNDTICGLDGNDTVIGFGGNDTIDARNGSADVVMGGTGVDTCIISGLRGTFMSSIERRLIDNDLAAWLPAKADTFEPTNPPQLAFDGLIHDWVDSGGSPPHSV